jgi:Phosphoribosyl-ATP pyrophosphohydrolase.
MGLADKFDKRREQDPGWNGEKWEKLSTREKLHHLRKSVLEENKELESLIDDLYFLVKAKTGRKEEYSDTYYVITQLIWEMRLDLDELFNNLHVRTYDAVTGDEI